MPRVPDGTFLKNDMTAWKNSHKRLPSVIRITENSLINDIFIKNWKFICNFYKKNNIYHVSLKQFNIGI